MYDVIVVGAGPAGCTASKVLAEKDGFVEVRLHGENNDTESARYVIDGERVLCRLCDYGAF